MRVSIIPTAIAVLSLGTAVVADAATDVAKLTTDITDLQTYLSTLTIPTTIGGILTFILTTVPAKTITTKVTTVGNDITQLATDVAGNTTAALSVKDQIETFCEEAKDIVAQIKSAYAGLPSSEQSLVKPSLQNLLNILKTAIQQLETALAGLLPNPDLQPDVDCLNELLTAINGVFTKRRVRSAGSASSTLPIAVRAH